jgi:hypothetical protein
MNYFKGNFVYLMLFLILIYSTLPLYSQQTDSLGIVDMSVESIKALNADRSLIEESIVFGDVHLTYSDESILESTAITIVYVFTENKLQSIAASTEKMVSIDEATLLMGKYFIELVGIFKSTPSISASFINYQDQNTINTFFEDDPSDNFFIPSINEEIPPAIEYRWKKESNGRSVFGVLNLSYIPNTFGVIHFSIWISK